MEADEKPKQVDPGTRLQLLAMENATLLAHRSQIWGDASGRAMMYLAMLSGSVVGIALAAQATSFGQGFMVFALLLLPVLLYAGLVTLGRLNELNSDDLHVIQSMNRIRHAMLELDPEIGPYLAMRPHDDWVGVSAAYAADGGSLGGRSAIYHGLRTLPAFFAVINCVVAAVLTAIIALELGLDSALVVISATVVFIALFVSQARAALTSIGAIAHGLQSHFPTPPPPDA